MPPDPPLLTISTISIAHRLLPSDGPRPPMMGRALDRPGLPHPLRFHPRGLLLRRPRRPRAPRRPLPGHNGQGGGIEGGDRWIRFTINYKPQTHGPHKRGGWDDFWDAGFPPFVLAEVRSRFIHRFGSLGNSSCPPIWP